MAVALSILDLVPVSSGQSVGGAIEASMEAARVADDLGYTRLWYAEHHNTAAVASSATAVLIGRAAAVTERIRVGSGGVMLPNHAPLMVAEAYGTLAQMFPGRIDLGLGRAPGTDMLTARALARSDASPESFMSNIAELASWFDNGVGSQGITAGVAAGTRVPLWVLGSSTSGALMAARLGLPYSFASHFAPDDLFNALHVYRSNFDPDAPTAQIDRPYVSVGVNVLAADDPEEAERQFTTVIQMFASMRISGGRAPLPPPVEPGQSLDPSLMALADQVLRVRAVGSAEEVAADLTALAEQTGADELITVTYAHDPAVRLRSLELVARACDH